MLWIQLFAIQYLRCSALSPSWEKPSLEVPPARWQVRRQSHEPIFTASLPTARGMTVRPKHNFHLILISFSLSYYLVAMSLPLCWVPSSRRPRYFNSLCSANASAVQSNQHPTLVDYATGVEKKYNQSFKKNTEASRQDFSLPLTPSLGLTLYCWKVKSSTPGVNAARLQVCDECGRPSRGTC